ncbi:hypothetical protein [Kitasatospora kifunensis]|uniref:Uncharacterized protein n=1 Tax=Kitasatospora kifunensis TaxID=58351 RepID=A0A7W7VW96_KITKI|nr:hypothetical protein [Kitasatospora kifunensis]MBB4925257.1 hypothetical protein [Kitasatospora kifunensis]
MTAPAPPPPQQPGQPQPLQPFQPQPPAFDQSAPYGYATLAAAPRKPGNLGAGIALGLTATLAGAVAYGFIMKAANAQWSYFAFALALVIALGLGKVGGRHPVLPVLGALCSLLGVFLGQLFFIFLVLHQQYGVGPTEVFGSDLGDTLTGWRSLLDAKDVFFYGIAAVEGFLLTRRFGRD